MTGSTSAAPAGGQSRMGKTDIVTSRMGYGAMELSGPPRARHIAEADVYEVLDAVTGGIVPVFVMPGTSHYPPIDSPLAFVSTIKAILLCWVAERRHERL